MGFFSNKLSRQFPMDFKFEKSLTSCRAYLTYCWLVNPDKKYNNYQATLLIKPDMKHILDDGKTEVDSAVWMHEQLEAVKKEFQDALLSQYPDRQGKFKWQRNGEGEPMQYWQFTNEGLTVKLKKKAGGLKKDNTPYTTVPPKFFKQEGDKMLLCTEEETKKYDKIAPESVGQVNIRITGYDLDYIGLRLEPQGICMRHFVPFVGGMQTAEDFGFAPEKQTAPPSSWEEETPIAAASASDF